MNWRTQQIQSQLNSQTRAVRGLQSQANRIRQQAPTTRSNNALVGLSNNLHNSLVEQSVDKILSSGPRQPIRMDPPGSGTGYVTTAPQYTQPDATGSVPENVKRNWQLYNNPPPGTGGFKPTRQMAALFDQYKDQLTSVKTSTAPTAPVSAPIFKKPIDSLPRIRRRGLSDLRSF